MLKSQEKLWKALAPFVVLAVLLLIPTPEGMPPQAWRYFAIFVAMIVGMILEPIPATAISFIAVTICVLSSDWVLFSAAEVADASFNGGKESLKWGLAG
ncbi:anion permease, partial [Yersinia enterocolitica]|nr:anion permease [Yersinia enterocolitica]